MRSLEKMFDPGSIAVIGASNTQGSVGFSIMKNLVGSGYGGTVYPVNPNRKNVMGIHCHKSVLELPEETDLAIVVTPAKIVPSVVRQCVEAKAKSIIVVSSGFGETGKEGAKLEKELKAIISGTGVRLLGPNCLGYIRTDKKVNASFAIRNALPGKMALISQSGALCSGILDWALKQNVGFKYFISVGSMLDVNFSDLIDFIQLDPEVEAIAIYMESLKDSRKFLSAARSFSRKKPIIVAKSGRFEESAKAAVSHTGSMAGNDNVFDAAFRRAGIVRVENVQELLGCAKALTRQPLPKGNRVAVITNAGGPGVMATDAIIKNGCRLAKISEEGMKELDKSLPRHWSRNNPVDVLGDASPERYEAALDVVLKEKDVDGVIVILSPQAISRPVEVAKAVVKKTEKSRKTILGCWMGEDFVEPARQVLRKKDLPSYSTPEQAVRVFSYMDSYRENIQNLYETPSEIPLKKKPNRRKVKAIIDSYFERNVHVINEVDSKEILAEYDLPVNRTLLSKSPGDAARKAVEMCFPVALKIVSDEITHKTDVGGVILNVSSEDEVKAAYRRMVKNARGNVPGANVLGVSVQKMIGAGNLELILGKKTDSIFGSVIMFGAGGIATEVFQDKSIGLPPLNQSLAKRIIFETRISSLFKGKRARLRADIPQLEKILVRFSQFVVEHPEIEEVDINPIIFSKGKFYAVDARIVLSKRRVEKQGFSHLAISPYPEELTRKVKAGKNSFLFRAIKPEDEPKMKALFKSFSEDTVRKRFFHPIKEMTHELLVKYCFNDYDREIAIVVEDRGKKERPLVGVGRFMKDIGKESAEFAIVVCDKKQNRGLGRKLLSYVEKVAKKRGLKKLWCFVSTDNGKMTKMLRENGYTTRIDREEHTRYAEKNI